MKKKIIILAAGKGSRMKSDLPKVMHKVGDKTMLAHVVDNCKKVGDQLILVYSDHLEPYLDEFKKSCDVAFQENQLGTAHAVSSAREYFDNQSSLAVIYGDNPLITAEIIENMFLYLKKTKASAITLTFEYEESNEYGKIILDDEGNFDRIVEHKFANDQERKIKLCNSGIMAFAPTILEKYLPICLINDEKHPEKEFYLTDIIEICKKAGEKVSYFHLKDWHNVLGVNTQEELKAANKIMKLYNKTMKSS